MHGKLAAPLFLVAALACGNAAPQEREHFNPKFFAALDAAEFAQRIPPHAEGEGIQLAKQLGTLHPILSPDQGKVKLIFSQRPQAELSELPPLLNSSFNRHFDEILNEIRRHCSPSPRQVEKLQIAGMGEMRRMLRNLNHFLTQSVNSTTSPEPEWVALFHRVREFNEVLDSDITRRETLFAQVVSTVLDDEQKARLRQAYMQSLILILEQHDMVVTSAQSNLIKQAAAQSKLEPLDLRQNYWRQYQLIASLGREKLQTIFSDSQIKTFVELPSDHRIAVSKANQGSQPDQ